MAWRLRNLFLGSSGLDCTEMELTSFRTHSSVRDPQQTFPFLSDTTAPATSSIGRVDSVVYVNMMISIGAVSW